MKVHNEISSMCRNIDFYFILGHRGQVCSVLWCSNGGWSLACSSFAFILETSTFFLCFPHPSRKKRHLLSYPLFICGKQFYLITFTVLFSSFCGLCTWYLLNCYQFTSYLMLLLESNVTIYFCSWNNKLIE